MKNGIAGLLLVIAVSVAAQDRASWPSPPGPFQPSAANLERMRLGEVLVEELPGARGGGAASAQALFRASPQDIWNTLGACAENFRFVRGLLECEVEQQTAEHAVTRQVAKKFWLAPRMAYRFETRRQPYQWIQVRLLDGDLKEFKGSWRFDPQGDSGLVLVTHEIHVQPDIPAPRWLVKRTLQRDLRALLACLRQVSGGSLDEAGRADDLARCPRPGDAES
jgi:hypothetical protein